jgi:hypothetical protein
MDPREDRIAIQKLLGHLAVDICGMKDILSFIQEKPCVSTEVIHHMMLCYISVHQGIAAQ